MQTISILRRATDHLRNRGVENSRLEAELLLADVLGTDRVGVYLQHDRPLSQGELTAYRDCIRRRSKHEPLQHIRGRQEFFSREFLVDGRVLVPRPETEILVEEALVALGNGARALDVGSGSGIIAVTLALEAPHTTLFAVDLSPDAVEVGRANAERLGARVEFRCGDLLAPFAAERFDLIVANLPYVRSDEIPSLQPEVRDFDPRLALDGGADGLELIRRLCAASASALEPGGSLLVEIGAGQRRAVEEMFRDAGFSQIAVRPDLAGIDRVVRATLAGGES